MKHILPARAQARALTEAAYRRCVAAGALPDAPGIEFSIINPREAAHGDYSGTFALSAAKTLGLPPRRIAEILCRHMDLADSPFASAEAVETGFINFRLSPHWYAAVLTAMEQGDFLYGAPLDEVPLGRVLVAFPAPGTPDDLRCCVAGDCLARILELFGASVCRACLLPDEENDVQNLLTRFRVSCDRMLPAALPAALDGGEFETVLLARTAGTALTNTPAGLEILEMPPLRLLRAGEAAGMSRRTGLPLTASELADEISPDAARFFLSVRVFPLDLDLAVRRDTENPLYRVRYAHARIGSLPPPEPPPAGEWDFSLLAQPEETALILTLARFPEELGLAVTRREPGRIPLFLSEAAAAFWAFYNACPLRGTPEARRRLAACTRDVLARGLALMAVNASPRS